LKNNILVVAAVLAVGCLIMVVLSSQAVDKTRKDLDQERYEKMVAEEKLDKTLAKVKSLEGDLASSQNQTKNAQATLEQEKQANTKLKTELEKVSKLKNVLEDQLKNALVAPAPQPAPAGN